MKIAVIGASGFTGKPVVELGLKQGHEIYAVSRSGKFEANDLLHVINQDVNDWKALAKQLKGVDVIISNFNAGWQNPNLYEDYLNGSRHILEISKLLDVPVVIVGGASSLYDEKTNKQAYDTMPEDFKKIVKGAFDLYWELKDNLDYKWIFVSPALDLNDKPATGNYQIGGDYIVRDQDGKSSISIYDLADFLIKISQNEGLIHKRLTLGNR